MAIVAAMGMAAAMASPAWAQTTSSGTCFSPCVPGDVFTPSAADQRRLIANMVAASPTSGLNIQTLSSFGGQIDKLLALGLPAREIFEQLRRTSGSGASAPGAAAATAAFDAQAKALAAAEQQRQAALSATVDRLKREQMLQAQSLSSGSAPAATSSGTCFSPCVPGDVTTVSSARPAGMTDAEYAAYQRREALLREAMGY